MKEVTFLAWVTVLSSRHGRVIIVRELPSKSTKVPSRKRAGKLRRT